MKCTIDTEKQELTIEGDVSLNDIFNGEIGEFFERNQEYKEFKLRIKSQHEDKMRNQPFDTTKPIEIQPITVDPYPFDTPYTSKGVNPFKVNYCSSSFFCNN